MTLYNINLKEQKAIVLLLSLIQFTHILDFMIIMPLGPEIIELFNITPTQFGLLVSCYTFAACAAGIIAGYFSDRFDRKKYLIITYLFFIVATFSCSFSSSYNSFLVFRLFTGLFGGVLGGIVYSIISDVIPTERRGRAMGSLVTAFSFASVLGVPLSLYIANLSKWSAPFIVVGILSTIVLIFIIKFVPTLDKHLGQKDDGDHFKKYIHVFSHKPHILSFIIVLFMMCASFSIIPYISHFMVTNMGIDIKQIPIVYLAGGFFTIFTAKFIGSLVDKKGAFKLYVIVSLFSIFPILRLTHHEPAGIYFALLTSVPLMIGLTGRMIPYMTMISNISTDETRGSYMSVFSSVRHVSTGIASYLGGVILVSDPSKKLLNFNHLGYLSTACTLIAIILCIFLNKMVSSQKSNELL
ncbi:MAG: putative MFS family arabinose efflux permease [Thermoproteota archaeon]|jgi:predicted MFS family arabinose efflux permease